MKNQRNGWYVIQKIYGSSYKGYLFKSIENICMGEKSKESKDRIIQGALRSGFIAKQKALKRKQSFYKKCKNPKCDLSIKYEQRRNKFCSHSCAAQVTNLGNRKWGNPPLKHCLVCNALLKSGIKYCSQDCANLKKWEKTKEKIELNDGFIKENRPIARKYLIEKFGNICQICKTTEWLGQPVPLICDHIDGDCTNNKLGNFRMICANCNQLLPTFGAKNIGKGQAYRRERYAEGKSY